MPLLCPHCERDLASHDGKPCPRKFSRRFFFGLMAGAAAVTPAASLTLNNVIRMDQIAHKTGMSVAVGEWNNPTIIKIADDGFPFAPGDIVCIAGSPELLTVVSRTPLQVIRGDFPNRQVLNFRT